MKTALKSLYFKLSFVCSVSATPKVNIKSTNWRRLLLSIEVFMQPMRISIATTVSELLNQTSFFLTK